jgi:hypothetical protein
MNATQLAAEEAPSEAELETAILKAVLNITIINSGTFAGAVCFLVGAYLLLPTARSDGETASAT